MGERLVRNEEVRGSIPLGSTNFPYARINVVGTSGSGKSTFARRLAVLLRAPVIELDALYWGPRWTPVADDAFLAAIAVALEGQPRWVVDGNYTRSIPVKWAAVEAVVWLDYSLATTLLRAVRRAFGRIRSGAELWPGTGNRESFRQTFLSRDSVLLWTLTSHAKTRRNYENLSADPRFAHIRFIRLRRAAEAEAFLRAMEQAMRPMTECSTA